MTKRLTDQQSAEAAQGAAFITFEDGQWILEDSDGNVIARAADLKDLPTV